MALNISIKSKYKPLTYRDLVAPFEDYWKDYEKIETDMAEAKADAYKLNSYLEALPKDAQGSLSEDDQKLFNQYNDYIKALEDIASNMSSSGLTRDIRKKALDMPAEYKKTILPIATAVEARNAALKQYSEDLKSGRWFGARTPATLGLSEFYGGKSPDYYSTSISSTDFEKEVKDIASAVLENSNPSYVKKTLHDITGLEMTRGYTTKQLQNALTSGDNMIVSGIQKQAKQLAANKLGYDSFDKIPSELQKTINNSINSAIISSANYKSTFTPVKTSDDSSKQPTYIGHISMRWPVERDSETNKPKPMAYLDLGNGTKNNQIMVRPEQQKLYNDIYVQIKTEEANLAESDLPSDNRAEDRASEVLTYLDKHNIAAYQKGSQQFVFIPYDVYVKNSKGKIEKKTKYYQYVLPSNNISNYQNWRSVDPLRIAAADMLWGNHSPNQQNPHNTTADDV